MKTPEIKAIIFDLGGVVLDIDYQLTVQAFKALGYSDFDDQYGKKKQSGLFDQLECGKISEAEFCDSLRTALPHASNEELINAWNALILNFPQGRLDYIRSLKARMPVFLLSNTNAIHLKCYLKVLEADAGVQNMDNHFHKVYLSHEIGLRKPNPEPFQLILDEQQLAAENTLFIDDSPQHIVTAQALGIQTIHLHSIHALEAELAPLLA